VVRQAISAQAAQVHMLGLRLRLASSGAWRSRSRKDADVTVSGRVSAVSARVAAALLSTLLTVAVLDRAVAFFDLTYTPARGHPNEERRIEHAEFSVDVWLNALGFRERRLPSPKPPGVLRVVALGDSFTQGYGVEEHDAWPRRLEAVLDARDGGRHEVVNLGVPGANPRDYVSHLQDPGLAYEPDTVIVTVMANDVQDRWVQREFGVQFASGVLADARRAVLDPPPTWTRIPHALFPALYPFVWNRLQGLRPRSLDAQAESLDPDATAAAAPSPVGDTAKAVLLALADRYGQRERAEAAVATMPADQLNALRPVLEGTMPLESDAATEPYLRVMALVQPRLFADAALLPRRYDAASDDVQRDLGRIVTLARGAGAWPVLVFAPAAQQVTAAARPYLESLGFAWDDRALTDTTFADRLRAFARTEGVPFVNLLPILRARRDDGLYFPKDGHWTPAGHALVAGVVAGALERAERYGTHPSRRASAVGAAR
jgi:lysophospholipase L1-like esterase